MSGEVRNIEGGWALAVVVLGAIAFAALVWTLVRGVYDGVSLVGVLAAVAMIVVGIVGSTRSSVRP